MRTFMVAVSISSLFACSAFAGQAAGAAKLNSCTLVTKADVQQVVGKNHVANPKPKQTYPAICDFKVGDYGYVSFMTQRSGVGDSIDKTFGGLRKLKIPVTEVKGIGDRAFFASPEYGITQLYAYKGPHYIILTLLIPGSSEAQQKAIAEKLILKALAKL
jgi:hypothetical protein